MSSPIRFSTTQSECRYGRSKRQASNCADMLIELRNGAGGFSPVAGIVNTRRDLVGNQATIGKHEELDADDADIIQCCQDREGCADCGLCSLVDYFRRQGGGVKNAVAVDVFDRIIRRRRAAYAARGDHRNLALEWHKAFQDQRHTAHSRKGARHITCKIAEDTLALAIIAEPPRLQYAAAVQSLRAPQ